MKLDDKKLDALLAGWRLDIDHSDSAIDAMARAARVLAVKTGAVGLKNDLVQHGLFGLIAELFGLRRSSAMWSAVAGMAFAAVIGLSLGASDNFTTGPETAFSIDFDSVLGSSALSAPQQIEQD